MDSNNKINMCLLENSISQLIKKLEIDDINELKICIYCGADIFTNKGYYNLPDGTVIEGCGSKAGVHRDSILV